MTRFDDLGATVGGVRCGGARLRGHHKGRAHSGNVGGRGAAGHVPCCEIFFARLQWP